MTEPSVGDAEVRAARVGMHERLTPGAAHAVPVRAARRRPAGLAGRAGPGRRVPGGRHHPRRGRPGLVLHRAALRHAGDVQARAGRRARAVPHRLLRRLHRRLRRLRARPWRAQGVPEHRPGGDRLPPLRDPRRRLRQGGVEVVPDGRPPAGGRGDPGRGRQRDRRAARAAGGARLGDRRPHPRAEQPGGRGDAGQPPRCGSGSPSMRDEIGELVRSDLTGQPARSDRRPGRTGARPPQARPRSCRRWRRPTARTSWPTGSRTTASTAAGTSPPRWSPPAWTWRGSSGWPRWCRRRTWRPGLSYPVRALESDGLLDEITEAAGRISELLASAKQYTQMDRAPLQTFDVHEGLDATLTMLGHKLGDGIEVVRDYDRSLPHIAAFPGELNQVWTNLIDNAVDAMEGHGTLTVRTRPGSRRPPGRRDRRHRTGRARRGPQPDLRAVLHHQADGQGHRPRPRHRLADRRRAPPTATSARVGRRATPGSRSSFPCEEPDPNMDVAAAYEHDGGIHGEITVGYTLANVG